MSATLTLSLFCVLSLLVTAPAGAAPPDLLDRVGGQDALLNPGHGDLAPAAPETAAEAEALAPNPPTTPGALDGGLGLLALAGGAYATRRLRRGGTAQRLGVAALLLGLLAPAASAPAASAQTLRPEVYLTDGTVSATALSADGATLYIGGTFSYVGPDTGGGAGISEAAGTVLPGSLYVNGAVQASAADGTGGFYIGGQFTQVGSAVRNRLVHLLSDGTLDAAFNPNLSAAGTEIYALALSGGVLYVGGLFSTFSGQPRNNLAAVDAATGAVTAFNPNAGNTVRALALSGGVLYAGGDFLGMGGQPRNFVAAVDAATGVPTAFDPNSNGGVKALAVGGGVVYVGGGFTTIGGQARANLALCDAATGVPTAVAPNPSSSVLALAMVGSTVYVGGAFVTFGGLTRNRLAALDATTGVPTAFDPNVNSTVFSLAVSGSVVYAGGTFTAAAGLVRGRLAAFDATTGAATAFDPAADNTVSALAAGGGVLYAGGSFASVGGKTRNNIAALNTATGAATAFNPSATGTGTPSVNALAVSGSTVYAGGTFTTIGGLARNRLAGLDATTGVATAFNPNVNNTVSALAVGGGVLYAGGAFTRIAVTTVRNRLAAFSTLTGAATAFAPSVTGAGTPTVNALAVSGSTVYAGGFFTAIGGTTRNRIAALDATTGAVMGFDPNASNTVNALAPSGGVVYVGGDFTTIGGQTRSRLAALDVTTGLATAFNPTSSHPVRSLALSGGVLYVGGDFTSIGGQPRDLVAALDVASGLATTFSPRSFTSVTALAVGGSTVYAGGSFNIGGQARNYLAAFTAPTVASSTSAGWRMLSTPVAGLTVGSLTATNLVGGVPGDPTCAASPANLYTGYTGGQTPGGNDGYTRPAAYTDPLVPGKGFFWYFFGSGFTGGPCGSGTTASTVRPLPVTLAASGTSPTADVATTFTAAERAATDDTFYLAGNPFGQGLDLDGTGAGLSSVTAADANGPVALQNSVQIWDAALGGYALKLAQADSGTNGTGGTSTVDDIAVWQGGWIERTSTATPAYPLTLTYRAANRTGSNSSGVFVGRSAGTEALRALRFEVSGTVGGAAVYDGAAALVFANGSTAAWDAYDGSKLPPFGSPYARLAVVGQDRAGALAEKASESLSLDPGAVDVPLAFTASGAGAFTLSWPGVETLPAEWPLVLTDRETGARTDLRQRSSYALASDAAADWTRRFTVEVGGRPVGTEGAPALVLSLGVSPNPVSNGGTVRVSLPAAGRVRVAVYDVLGRSVAVLVDGDRTAGMHDVALDAGRLAPGVYIVRLTAGEATVVRRVTVAR